MLRAFISIIFFILSGMFIYGIEVISFYSPLESENWRVPSMILLVIPALLLLLTGHWILKFAHWKRHTGMVLTGTTLFAIFIGVTLLFMSLSEDFVQSFGQQQLPRFTDYALGVPVTVGMLCLGLYLYLSDI